MIVTTNAVPEFVIVEPDCMLPRFWATVWSLAAEHQGLKANTRVIKLRHINSLYTFCDRVFGLHSFDSAVGSRDAVKVRCLVERFYLELTSRTRYTSTLVQCWDAVRSFVESLAVQRAVGDPEWKALVAALKAMGRLRAHRQGQIRFIRSLHGSTLVELLNVSDPASNRNPFVSEKIRFRNWLIVNLLLFVGLRRGELMLLNCSSIKSDVDVETGEMVYWIDVTTTPDDDQRYSQPSIKTSDSHRQVPISETLAEVLERYVSTHREQKADHDFLLTSTNGGPLSAEAINKLFGVLSDAIDPLALSRFTQRSGKRKMSPHDLRHTCATARYAMFMARDSDRELTFQRLRAFFGWSDDSSMPEHYARAAVQDDLMRTWNTIVDTRVEILRGLPS